MLGRSTTEDSSSQTTSAPQGKRRNAGVLLPISALPGRGPIGDLDAAPAWIDQVATMGAECWQLLPLNPVDKHGSPYSSWSSLSCEPALVGIEYLKSAGLLSEQMARQDKGTSGVDYTGARDDKLPQVERAAQQLLAQPSSPLAAGFAEFAEKADWAHDAGLFRALGHEFGGEPWWKWPAPIRDAEPDALKEARERHEEEILRWVAISFLFESQWNEVREYAKGKNIQLIGDMPIYVAHNSVDVWLHQELFQLGEDGCPVWVAGVPPDAYAEEGQTWGNPLYDWDAVAAEGYAWWLRRLGRARELYDVLRFDHFIGLDRYWAIPAADDDARGGSWREGPGLAALDAFTAPGVGMPMIAEDLGAVREETYQLREARDLPGMRVMAFAWGAEQDSVHRLRRHEEDCIVYSSTHDTDTARGVWESRKEGHRFPDDFAQSGQQAARRIVGMTLRSQARCAVIPAQDILELGTEARMNRPGTTTGNWQWRLSEGAFTAEVVADFRVRLERSSRLRVDGPLEDVGLLVGGRDQLSGPKVVYFCMEYGISAELPIYSGGLGVLAGDIVKAARDQERDFVAIGVLWGEGYFVQKIAETGEQRAEYIPTPRERLRKIPVEVNVTIAGEEVAITAWRVENMGSVELILLEPVKEQHREITRRLYAGSGDDRVKQELLLGVGGVRMLRALGFEVDVYHFNEGHALFAGFELMREKVEAGKSFDEAIEQTRAEVIFTTHTPVPAGNETHPIERLLACGADLGVFRRDELVRLGGDPFEMTPAALRLSREANAVAELHGQTARAMWAHIESAAPIRAITNGVHMGSWQDARVGRLARGAHQAGLWERHQELKQQLLDEIELRSGSRLRPDVLLIGFARRAATYKRATLMLRNRPWLKSMFDQGQVQFVFAGKAHPQDQGGQTLIHELVQASREFPEHLVFLENYDMHLGALLTRGCDVWLNNPVRPKEASGTSGMKAAANGVLNLSILDGWWDEGCEHGVNGWGVGAPPEGEDADDHDYQVLRDLLENEVIPTYVERPDSWREMMRQSIVGSEVRFSADRCVQRYFSELYGPA